MTGGVCVCSGGWRSRPVLVVVDVCGAGSAKIWPLAIVVTGCCKGAVSFLGLGVWRMCGSVAAVFG